MCDTDDLDPIVGRADLVAGPLQPNSTYLVPTLFARWPHPDEKPAHWPVIGPKHDDMEVFRFPWPHYHPDRRFLSRDQAQMAEHTPIVFNAAGVSGELPKPFLWAWVCRYPVNRSWFFARPGHALHQVYAGRRCGKTAEGVLVCPHKGHVLRAMGDASGLTVCPLHGLPINTKTGRVMPVPQPKRQNPGD